MIKYFNIFANNDSVSVRITEEVRDKMKKAEPFTARMKKKQI